MSELAMVLAAVAVVLIVVAMLQRPGQRTTDANTKGERHLDPSSKKRKKKKRKTKRGKKSTKSVASSREAGAKNDVGSTGRSQGEGGLARIRVEEDGELELTKLTLGALDEETIDETDRRDRSRQSAVIPIVFDEEAAIDEPTGSSAFILVSAVGQSDRGRRRKRNEDRLLVMNDPPLYLVADGMGGYAGGDVAAALAVDEIQEHANGGFPDALALEGLPRRGSELVSAIQAANKAIYDAAQDNRDFREMGTTLVCARFSPNKQRVYIGHVGDSRCYLIRDGEAHQVTSDHTAEQEHGVVGPLANTLTRALGISPNVVVDLILGKPYPGDRYVLCSDGLTKMVTDQELLNLVEAEDEPEQIVSALIAAANAAGGKDNVTVIVICVNRTGS